MSIAYIDWGGTHFRCVIEGKGATSFEKRSKEIDIVKELQEIFAAHEDVSRVGISFAGQVKDNVILSAPNIAAKELDLNAIFKDKKIFIQNDLKCAALAEAAYWKEESVVAIYVGTGIGSAYIESGRLISGCENMAGEIGHIPYRVTGAVCGCGKGNCLELTASGSGLEKRAKLAGLNIKRLEELKNSIDGKYLADEFAEGVGYAVSLAVTMLNPKIVVIGGGIALSNAWLGEFVKEFVSKNAFHKSADACAIKISQLANGSLEGARLLAL